MSIMTANHVLSYMQSADKKRQLELNLPLNGSLPLLAPSETYNKRQYPQPL